MSFKISAIIAVAIISTTIGQIAFASAVRAPGHPANVKGMIRLSFGPSTDANSQISYTLANARNQVLIVTDAITNVDFASMLIRMKKSTSRHMDIRIIIDSQGTSRPGSQLQRLSAAGIPIYVNVSRIITDNVIIADAQTVLTSSAPFTKNLTRTQSANIIVFPNQPAVSDIYFKHWMANFHHCVVYSGIDAGRTPQKSQQNSVQRQSLLGKLTSDTSRATQARNRINKYRIDLKHLF